MNSAEVERLVVRLMGDASSYKKELKKAEADTTSFKRSMDRSLDHIKGSFERLAGVVQSAARQLRYLSLAFSGAVFAGLGWGTKLNADAQSAAISFSVLLKSQEKAAILMQQLNTFSAKTPFQLPDVTQAARSLLAFGISEKEILNTLRMVGDISSGINQPLGEIAEIYGKARVQGRLFMEDINQLTGRGIPVIQGLAKQFGVAESEVRKLVSTGKVSFDNLKKAFEDLTSTGGMFEGMMAELSASIGGKFSTLKDNLAAAFRDLGKIIAPVVEKLMDIAATALKWWAKLTPEVKQVVAISIILAAVLGPVVTTMGVAFASLLVIIPSIVSGIGGLVSVFAALSPFLPEIAAIGLAIVEAFVATAALVYLNWDKVKTFLLDTWESIKKKAAEIYEAMDMEDTIEGVKQALAGGEIELAFSVVTQKVKLLWMDLGMAVKTVAYGMVKDITSVAAYIPGVGIAVQLAMSKFDKSFAKSISSTAMDRFFAQLKLNTLLREASNVKPVAATSSESAQIAQEAAKTTGVLAPAASQAIQAARSGSAEAMDRIMAYRSSSGTRSPAERSAASLEQAVAILTEIRDSGTLDRALSFFSSGPGIRSLAGR